MTAGLFPAWKLKSEGMVLPEERLPTGQTITVGLQHVFTMFGSTVVLPIFMGFDPNLAILFSGVGTLIFLVAVGFRVPSYLGASGSFVPVVIAATVYAGSGANPNIGIALGGIITAGLLYTLIGIAVVAAGHAWVERLMPPVVTGAVIAVIGLNLAPIAVKGLSRGAFDAAIAVITVATIGAIAVFASEFWRRIPILIGGTFAYIVHWVLANGLGLGTPIDFHRLGDAAWFGAPIFFTPAFDINAMIMIAPVAVVLVAENLGHIKALGVLIGGNLDPYLGRAFIGNGIATIVAASGGGTGLTTYAENIGVMGITNVYSTLVFVAAAMVAILFGFSPKFDALILTIPGSVIGGASIFVFGLVVATGARVWVENNVDFTKAGNLITVGVCLILGAGNLTVDLGGFSLGGIGTATLGAIIIYQLLHVRSDAAAGGAEDVDPWAMRSELNRANRQLVIAETAASIVHDIRQPLTAMIANASAGLRWLDKTPADLNEARTNLTAIVRIGNHANESIEGIRAMLKRDRKEHVALNVNKLIVGLLTTLGDELQSHEIIVQTELADDLPLVLGDRLQLQQVILNLITNAIDAMSSVAGRPRMLRLKTEIQKPHDVLVSVEDSGSGIDPKDVDRIFDTFFTTKSSGMGMGLAICRSIIEAHQGRLWASAGIKYGTVFRFTLPKATSNHRFRLARNSDVADEASVMPWADCSTGTASAMDGC
jgi:putative pyrimidine permease RutG